MTEAVTIAADSIPVNTTDTAEADKTWHEASHLDDLWEGEMVGVDVAGHSVLLVNHDGEVIAYKNRCPHQEWPLDDGDLEEKKLTCAQHLWEFDVTTGKGINPSTCALISYECKVDDDGAIWVRA
ncbi:putative Rieske (2Fe-2S) ferredoxin [Gordonia polyisoprenivorans VH2]|uniref:Putative Rieske (2Fe-2S) ferredoxin n=1 Tax=Gordonia polyisoprenivorans (strain DSM 44266 / VH2) TaxID=1112204 RepID=H6MYN4_GORPV|nr:Rieske 2Fe-2S domain-containing protein [Gordonia polyisoprenivorans]AFA71912.1 putative Rieske (2Fe-2S) ferredoxin [Gordonia polyisoprenivorans VH2]WCB38290.1 Rieske 2Fe-2S domain-containing protein [Gordonia polyisoprenivorans]